MTMGEEQLSHLETGQGREDRNDPELSKTLSKVFLFIWFPGPLEKKKNPQKPMEINPAKKCAGEMRSTGETPN